MLPLPRFVLHEPTSIDEALDLLASHGAQATLIAGGTDLLPNMKHGLLAPRHLVSLARVDRLRRLAVQDGALHVGAMVTLDALSSHEGARAGASALSAAAAAVGGPQHRRMGTVGGNLCLDTRCRYFNQTEFWRQALGYCLKKDGTECHVVPGGRKCVAAASNDTAAAAIALGASVVVARQGGARELPVEDFYVADGLHNTVLEPGEVLVELIVPLGGRTSAYEKLRPRGAIDFPQLSVAASVAWEGETIGRAVVVVSALAARPRVVRATGQASGQVPSPELVAKVAAAAQKECVPLTNMDADAGYRREMVAVLVRRALGRAIAR